jgi:hypothetical protein
VVFLGFFGWVFLGGFFWVGFLMPTLQEGLSGKNKKSQPTIKEKEGWQEQGELEGPDYKKKKGWLQQHED